MKMSRGVLLILSAMGLFFFHAPVSRAQMACTGSVFGDVDSTSVGPTFCAYIEQFAALGITGGCSVSPPLFCPDSPVTRGQMAVFLSVARNHNHDSVYVDVTGDTMSGAVSDGPVLSVTNSATGYAIRGIASDTGIGQNYGGFFSSQGSDGSGVYGVGANDGDASNNGGYFVAHGATGRGVYGVADYDGNTVNYGGRFVARASGGRGTYGLAQGINGVGVHGNANNTGVGTNYGGYFEASSTSSRGVYANGNAYDFYAGGTGTNYGPFTGGHEVKLSEDFPAEVRPGMIVSVTGQTRTRHRKNGTASLSSTLPTVRLSHQASDKAVFGVFVTEAPLHEDHWYQARERERFATVNALGEGRVWVSDLNGKIDVGDYITTSSIAGYGQKQGDDLLHSYTLGKVIEDVDWDSVTETVSFEGRTYKIYLIAVVYTSG